MRSWKTLGLLVVIAAVIAAVALWWLRGGARDRRDGDVARAPSATATTRTPLKPGTPTPQKPTKPGTPTSPSKPDDRAPTAAAPAAADDDPKALPQPVCVWNHAYEEHRKTDAVSAILAGARSCYVLIDPFQSASVRDAIPRFKASGNVVGCYVSVGSCEKWREDHAATKPFCGPAYPGWPGETFVTDPQGILPLIKARLDKMAGWGCDMVEFDNMDWADDAKNKARVRTEDAHAYVRAICAHTRAKGMKCMAKNTTYGTSDFDGLTVESYVRDKNWWSTRELRDTLGAGKIGVIVHYKDRACDAVYRAYKKTYGDKLSYICSTSRGYRHYN